MNLFEKYGLSKVINARGTFTPLGVSRSSAKVQQAVAESLGEFFIIDELLDVLSQKVADLFDVDGGTITHCTAASITLAVAAAVSGDDPQKIALLPDTSNMKNEVVLPATHAVNFGQPIVQAIRLSGATLVLAGSEDKCILEEIERTLNHKKTACLLLVSSFLTKGDPLDFKAAVKMAHAKGIPVIIDGAAQDMRVRELLATEADLVLVSAQKYLSAPTAGLVIGKSDLVKAVRGQFSGIGRAMKPTKESLIGVLAALEEREQLDFSKWNQEQLEKVSLFANKLKGYQGVDTSLAPDPAGAPVTRIDININADKFGISATELAEELKKHQSSIWLSDQNSQNGQLTVELIAVNDKEIEVILQAIQRLSKK